MSRAAVHFSGFKTIGRKQFGRSMSDNPLYWDATYAIVRSLMKAYPETAPEDLSTNDLLQLILNLPNFADEAILAHEDLLVDILKFWYEEAIFND